MNLEKAIEVASENLALDVVLLRRISDANAKGKIPNRSETTLLVVSLRSALSAAMEIDNRTAGVREPKSGD
jgi:hypothetical protein